MVQADPQAEPRAARASAKTRAGTNGKTRSTRKVSEPAAKTNGSTPKRASSVKRRKSSISNTESPVVRKKRKSQTTLDEYASVESKPQPRSSVASATADADESMNDEPAVKTPNGSSKKSASAATIDENVKAELDTGAKDEAGGDDSKKNRKKPGPKPRASLPKPVIHNVYHEEDLPWLSDSEPEESQPEKTSTAIEDCYSIAELVHFNNTFRDLMDGVPELGPQDIEQGVQLEHGFSLDVQAFMCKMMSLMLNRKKMVEVGRYGRALEEIQSQLKSNGIGYGNFSKEHNLKHGIDHLPWQEKLEFLRMLSFWVLCSSDVVHTMLTNGTIELLEPTVLGHDGNGDKYYLFQGEGTPFRVYKETNPRLKKVFWKSLAGNTDELKHLIDTLRKSAKEVEKLPSEEDKKIKEEPELPPQETAEAISIYSFQPWAPLKKDKVETINQLIDRLKGEESRLRQEEEDRIKEHHRERRRRQVEEDVEKARAGEGRYVGRTRGKKINYNVDEVYEDQASDGDEYGGAGAFDNDEDPDNSTVSSRASRRSARIRDFQRFASDEILDEHEVPYDDEDEEEEEEEEEPEAGVEEDAEEEEQQQQVEQELDENQASSPNGDSHKSRIVVLKYSSPVGSSPPSNDELKAD